MLRREESGATTPMALPMVILSVIVVIMTVVAIWAYSQYTAQKNNVDALVDEAIVEAEDDLRAELQEEFNEKEKSPLEKYTGSQALGSVSIKYPKTWSAYVIEKETSRTPIDGYFHPGYVPDVKSDTAFALRLEIVDDTFDDEVDDFDKRVKDGDVRSRPITISGVEGVRLDGEVNRDREGAMVLLPLRDKTIKLSTESVDFIKDFNKIIIENLSFIP